MTEPNGDGTIVFTHPNYGDVTTAVLQFQSYQKCFEEGAEIVGTGKTEEEAVPWYIKQDMVFVLSFEKTADCLDGEVIKIYIDKIHNRFSFECVLSSCLYSVVSLQKICRIFLYKNIANRSFYL